MHSLKELLIHIGYPKTATTTLQEGVFLKLHHMGLINFLGRTQKSTHTKFGFSHFKGRDWVVDIRKEFLFGKSIKERGIVLKPGILNVLSDEDLTIHPEFHKAQFGIERNPLDLVPRLKQLFSEADKVIVLLTLRNQSELIPSCYLQKYRFMHDESDIRKFDAFLMGWNGSFREDTSNVFNFKYVTDYYRRFFEGPYKFLFFEDLKSDRALFVKSLAEILGVGTELVESILNEAHYRNKAQKKSGKHFTSVSESYGLGRLIEYFMGKDKFMNFMNRFWYMHFSVFRKYFRKMLVKDVHIETPEITPQHKTLIRTHFSESNKMLAADFNLDSEKMKLYGYFN